MSTINRNDPCHCGSGQKYKKCHMKEDQQRDKDKRNWTKAAWWIKQDMIKYAKEEQFALAFAGGLARYWNNHYTIENAEEMSMQEALRFIDWFAFDYETDDFQRVLDTYHEQKWDDLSEFQQQVLKAWLAAAPSSAYELLSYEGQLLHVKEFLTDELVTVYEPGGRGQVEPGDLLLARIVEINGVLEFSSAPAYLPQAEIGDLREKMAEVRDLYLAENEGADYAQFMRRNGHLIIHHALAQAEALGRPPVAASDLNRTDKYTQKAAQQAANQMRKLQSVRARFVGK